MHNTSTRTEAKVLPPPLRQPVIHLLLSAHVWQHRSTKIKQAPELPPLLLLLVHLCQRDLQKVSYFG
jgi:hypothetical protein